MNYKAISLSFATALGISLIGACTAFEKVVKLKPAPCEVDMADYSGRLNGAFTNKARQINALAARESAASLSIKLKIPIGSTLINAANQMRKRALEQLCDKCSASALFKQDSLLFIEVHSHGYSYTLYVLNNKNQGIGYQRICSQPVCKTLAKVPDNSLLTINKGEYFDGYGLFYVRSRYVNKVFITEDISFLGSGAIEVKLL